MNRWHLLFVPGLLGLAACSSAPREEPAPSPEAAAEAFERSLLPGGARVMVAGFEFHAPADWASVPPSSNLRVATLQYGPVGSDKVKAELNVYYFGPDQGGSVEANFERWLSQVTRAQGEEAERETFTVAGFPIHVVRADGTYAGGAMSGDTEPKAGWRMVGAVLEGSQGNIFFKMVGPEASVRAMEPGLREMLESLSKGRE